jgi:hypothetical protein
MIEKLACKLGRNDEVPNIELAKELCESNDVAGVVEIVDGFMSADKAVANDCIKVLYEIGERKPELVAGYANEFISCLHSKNNRLAWGSMTALAKIAQHSPKPIFEKLPTVISAYEGGSVITVDNSISVFAGLCKADANYAKKALPLLINHLQKCRPKQVAQHSERASVCFDDKTADAFIGVLEKRLPDLIPSGQARVNKLLKQLHSLTIRQQH